MTHQPESEPERRLLAGKIVFNFGQSVLECVVRRMTADGATIEVASSLGIPSQFNLICANEKGSRRCKVLWQTDKQLGVAIESAGVTETTAADTEVLEKKRIDPVRAHMLALRAALDQIEVGVVLLGSDLRAQFINQAFRRMWQLSDEKADRHPSFLSLLQHGRHTNAYEVADEDLDRYIEDRIALVQGGSTAPLDLRRAGGDVLRMQVAVLPDGGRLISYTDVTDIVRHSDELQLLQSSLDKVDEGIAIFDGDLRARFLNQRVRKFWDLGEDAVEDRPALADLMKSGAHSAAGGLPDGDRDAFFDNRIAQIKAGDTQPIDLPMTDGRHLRARCTALPSGGRMLTYTDITDLVQNAKQLETFATMDDMTGLYNRRHFMKLAKAEWSRFRRYGRPLSLLSIDIDMFKSINDRYGHAAGDEAIRAVAGCLQHDRRASDIFGRLGGEEFAVLLPETRIEEAAVVAEKIRKCVASRNLTFHRVHFGTSVSVGIAEAKTAMAAVDVLFKAADDALYTAKAKGRDRCEIFASNVTC